MDERLRREALEAQNSELRERVRVLEELMFGVHRLSPFPIEWGLTGKEELLLGFMCRRELVTKEAAMLALYGLNASGEVPEIKIIDVFICKLRKKLPAHVKVSTIWGRGYSLDGPSRARWAADVRAAEAA